MMWYLAEETVLFVLRYRIVTIVYFLGVSDSWILCSLDPRLKPGLALAIWSKGTDFRTIKPKPSATSWNTAV